MCNTKFFILQFLLLLLPVCAGSAAPQIEPIMESPEARQELRTYDANVRQNPKDPDAYVDRAKFWFDHMELDQARADLKRAIDIRPTGFAYYWLGKANFDPKNTKPALDCFAKARAIGGA